MSNSNASNEGVFPFRKARIAVRIVIAAIIIVSVGFHTGWGTYSSIGIDFIASICPLGALEAMFGSFAFVPRLVIALVAMLVIAFLVGRAFCSWVCPVPPLQSLFSSKARRAAEKKEREEAGEIAYDRWRLRASSCEEGCEGRCKGHVRFDSRHVVLCGALGSAAIFGFPVFCLVCPVGLTCATVVLLMRLMGVGELSWGLLVFPVMLVLELTVLRKYCERICPIAALLSLVGSFGRTFRIDTDANSCLRTAEGVRCHACSDACPQHIDPHSNDGLIPEGECTRCGACVEACPAHALSLPLLRGQGAAVPVEAVVAEKGN